MPKLSKISYYFSGPSSMTLISEDLIYSPSKGGCIYGLFGVEILDCFPKLYFPDSILALLGDKTGKC
jgi:hypothetical protein